MSLSPERPAVVAAPARRTTNRIFACFIAALIGGFIIAAHTDITPAQAQKFDGKSLPKDLTEPIAPPPKTGPKTKLKGNPNPKCPECTKAWQDLKAALEDFFLDQWQDGKDQQKAETDKGSSDADQKAINAAQGKMNAANTGLDQTDPGGKKSERDKRHEERKKQKDYKKPDVNKINELIDALNKCAGKCATTTDTGTGGGGGTGTGTGGGGGTGTGGGGGTGTGGGGGTGTTAVCHWPGYDALADDLSDKNDLKAVENWCKNLKLPTCGDPKKVGPQITELLREIDEKINAIFAAVNGGHGGPLKDAGAAADKECKAAKATVEAFEKNTLPNLKPCPSGEKTEECPPKTGGGGGGKTPEKKKPPGKKKVIEKRGSSSNISVPVQPSGGSLSIGIGGGGGYGGGGGGGGSRGGDDDRRRR